ncbi:MAG: Flp family type IVb pilin [Pirellulaceae bacterium]|nr:Flp family type IVb pilin [Pirellulaceae bacterium]
MKLVTKLLQGEEGATMVEYALLVALVGLVAAAGAVLVGGGLNTMFTSIGGELNTATIPDVP